jgi:formylglycine-generating enzyme required for sulfatase activity
MMGNVWEWMESPGNDPNYNRLADRVVRGGSFTEGDDSISPSIRAVGNGYSDSFELGFRVASRVPEPSTLGLMLFAGLMLLGKRRLDA